MYKPTKYFRIKLFNSIWVALPVGAMVHTATSNWQYELALSYCAWLNTKEGRYV